MPGCYYYTLPVLWYTKDLKLALTGWEGSHGEILAGSTNTCKHKIA